MRWIFVDRFVTLEKGRYAKAIKNVSMGEEHLHDHFPSYPVMPNTLIIEALAQTGGLLAGHSTDFKEKVILAKIEKGLHQAGSGQTLSHAHVKDRMAECLK